MRRSGVQVLYPAPPRWMTTTSAMKGLVEFLPMSHLRLIVLSLMACGPVLPGLPVCGHAVAGAAGAEPLPSAQTRLRYAQEELESAQLQVRRQEQRLKDAEDSLARQQKRLGEEQATGDRRK